MRANTILISKTVYTHVQRDKDLTIICVNGFVAIMGEGVREMANETSISFSEDYPVLFPEEDVLNRAPFARHLASVLLNLPIDKGFVVGIYGKWGEGKSSVLGMTKSFLAEREDYKDIVVRDFNPWRLVDEERIIRGFMDTITDAIECSLGSRKEKATEGFWKILSYVRIPIKAISLFFKPADSVDAVLDQLEKVSKSADTLKLEELRSRLIPVLDKSSKRVIVFIDDIDRLDKDETHTLFRLIKACADLPKIVFVLAFDDEVVAASLDERFEDGRAEAGRAFLEKIIQLPLRIPAASPSDVESLCMDAIKSAIVSIDIDIKQADRDRFGRAFKSSIADRLTTARTSKRYANTVQFAVLTLSGEVNLIDLMLLESMRMFYPELYSVIRNNQQMFSGKKSQSHGMTSEEDKVKSLVDMVLDGYEDPQKTALIELAKAVFPRLSQSYGNLYFGSESTEQWDIDKRACSPQYCERYFNYAIPKRDIADSSISEFYEVARSGDLQEASIYLSKMMSDGKAKRLIEKIKSQVKIIDADTASMLAVALSVNAHLIPNPPALFPFAEPFGSTAILVSHLLERIENRDKRLTVAKEVVSFAAPIWFANECLRWFRVTDEEEKESSNALSEEEYGVVEKLYAERIESYIEEGNSLVSLDEDDLKGVLFTWAHASGKEAVQAYLLSLFEGNENKLGEFLVCMADYAWGSVSPHPYRHDYEYSTLDSIDYVIDLDKLATLVLEKYGAEEGIDDLSRDTQKNDDQKFAEQFMRLYKKQIEKVDDGEDGEPNQVVEAKNVQE